jgi:hypothetical protein
MSEVCLIPLKHRILPTVRHGKDGWYLRSDRTTRIERELLVPQLHGQYRQRSPVIRAVDDRQVVYERMLSWYIGKFVNASPVYYECEERIRTFLTYILKKVPSAVGDGSDLEIKLCVDDETQLYIMYSREYFPIMGRVHQCYFDILKSYLDSSLADDAIFLIQSYLPLWFESVKYKTLPPVRGYGDDSDDDDAPSMWDIKSDILTKQIQRDPDNKFRVGYDPVRQAYAYGYRLDRQRVYTAAHDDYACGRLCDHGCETYTKIVDVDGHGVLIRSDDYVLLDYNVEGRKRVKIVTPDEVIIADHYKDLEHKPPVVKYPLVGNKWGFHPVFFESCALHVSSELLSASSLCSWHDERIEIPAYGERVNTFKRLVDCGFFMGRTLKIESESQLGLLILLVVNRHLRSSDSYDDL